MARQLISQTEFLKNELGVSLSGRLGGSSVKNK